VLPRGLRNSQPPKQQPDPKPRTAAEGGVAGSRGRSGCFGRRASRYQIGSNAAIRRGRHPEGEAEFRGETGIEGLNSGQRAAALKTPTPGKPAVARSRGPNGPDDGPLEALKKQVGNSDPLMVAEMGGRQGRAKSRFEMPAPDRRDAGALASQDPLLSKEAAASITRYSGISLGPHRLRPSAGRERGCKSDHLEPFLWATSKDQSLRSGRVVSELRKKHRAVRLTSVEHTDEELHRP
jgi:hypothetical protein